MSELTRDMILSMEAGPALDALVAERVMGESAPPHRLRTRVVPRVPRRAHVAHGGRRGGAGERRRAVSDTPTKPATCGTWTPESRYLLVRLDGRRYADVRYAPIPPRVRPQRTDTTGESGRRE